MFRRLVSAQEYMPFVHDRIARGRPVPAGLALGVLQPI